MSNYPSDFNAALFSSTIGSRQTDAEADAEADYDLALFSLQKEIKAAFDIHAGRWNTNRRWAAINSALVGAIETMRKHATLCPADDAYVHGAKETAKDASREENLEWAMQAAKECLHPYKQEYERVAASCSSMKLVVNSGRTKGFRHG